MNQCDGCRCGWPIDDNGIHRDPNPKATYKNPIGCTKDRYTKSHNKTLEEKKP